VTIEIGPNLHFVERGWLNANHFIYNGAEPALIDTAYYTGLEETLGAISELGVELSAIKRIILTHVHSDHVGGVKHIQDASGCRVLLHPVSRHHIDTRNRWATWWRYYDHEADFFETHQSLEDGDRVELGELSFEVVHTPGHSVGMVTLFEPREGILISSDALWEGDLGVLTPRLEGSDCVFRALASLDRLAELKAKVVYPGHGGPITEVEEALEGARSRLRRFIEDPKAQGRDQIRKIIVFTLLQKGGLPAGSLFDNIMEAPWFGETVSLFFGNERPRPVFDQVIEDLIKNGAVMAEQAILHAAAAA